MQNRVSKAVILAAGRGLRLGSLTSDRPKPMVPVAGRPCLDWIVRGIRNAGILDFVIITGYLGDVIERYFGSGTDLGVQITYLHQSKLNGTGGALNLAREAVGCRPFLLSWGDILVDPRNYSAIRERFERERMDAALGLNWVDDPFQGGAVYLDDKDRVLRIIEKPPRDTSTTHWNQAGLFCFQPLVFEYTAKLRPSPRGELELPQAITQMVADGRQVVGVPLVSYWGDIGTPGELERMSRILEDLDARFPTPVARPGSARPCRRRPKSLP